MRKKINSSSKCKLIITCQEPAKPNKKPTARTSTSHVLLLLAWNRPMPLRDGRFWASGRPWCISGINVYLFLSFYKIYLRFLFDLNVFKHQIVSIYIWILTKSLTSFMKLRVQRFREKEIREWRLLRLFVLSGKNNNNNVMVRVLFRHRLVCHSYDLILLFPNLDRFFFQKEVASTSKW
jgi:hypothetical protein